MSTNTIGANNTAVGYTALYSNTTGLENTAVGQSSGYDITTGRTNTLLGFNTGRGITTGNYNTILGANVTGLSTTLANNIIIADGQGNRRINVDNTGNVGIGTTSPTQKLHIQNGYLLVDTNSAVGSGIWMPDTNGNPSLRIVTDQSDASYTSIINNWGANTNSGVMVGTVRSDGTAFQVRSAVTVTSGFANADGTTRFIVNGNGNVGIGTTSPSTILEVVGTITCTTLVETSSVATKTNVKKLNSQTAKLSKLVPVSFNYKKDNKRSLGLIAEEVAQVYPELVEYENGRPLGVNYSKLTAVLISTVNELAAEVAELKKQLNK